MKIIVMGTGPFAVPAFRWLMESKHEVCMVVTRPIDDAGKRRKSVANPVREYAESIQGMPIYSPRSANDDESIERLAACQADLLFVCDYGQILKKKTLQTTRLGGINLHGSLLPKYRGAAPVNWAIYRGETETGVTVIHMTPKLDGGPALSVRSLPIGDSETAEQLEPRMSVIGVDAVAESIQLLESWDGESTIGEIQDASLVTKAPRLGKQQGRVDWTHSARQISNQVRAFKPWPGTFTHWLPAAQQGKPVRLILHSVQFDESETDVVPGQVVATDESSISIATGAGILKLLEIQPAGKKCMPVTEFLRGRRVQLMDKFGDLPD